MPLARSRGPGLKAYRLHSLKAEHTLEGYIAVVSLNGNGKLWDGKTPQEKAWTPRSVVTELVPNNLVAGVATPCNMPVPHWHAQVEVNFIYSGAVTYRMSGHTVHLSAGDLCLFWGGQPHRAIHSDPNTEFVAIHLPLVHFFRLRLSPDVMHRLTRGASIVTRSEGHADSEMFQRLTGYMRDDDSERREHAIDELLLRINRIKYEPYQLFDSTILDVSDIDPLDTSSFRNVIDICSYITENFRDNIDSSDIASSVEIHPKYAMSVFKKSTGMTLNEYITLLRLSYAQALLLDDKISILDIALDSGFGSLSAFSQSFRKIVGQSASEFRKQATAHRLGAPG